MTTKGKYGSLLTDVTRSEPELNRLLKFEYITLPLELIIVLLKIRYVFVVVPRQILENEYVSTDKK